MSYRMDHPIEMDHYHALLREAEQYRLARQALEGRQKKQTAWCKGLSWLGARLSAWGKQLQESYGIAAPDYTIERRHADGEQIIKGIYR